MIALASLVSGALLAAATGPGTPASPAAATGKVDFVTQIKPIFARSCVSCHGPDKERGGLRMDLKDRFFGGGASGPVIVAGKGESSLLVRRLVGDDKFGPQMPNNAEALPAAEIALVRAWIDQGAAWRDEDPSGGLVCKDVPPPPPALRRLTNREYGKTIEDLLGIQLDAVKDLHLPEDASVDGYDNHYEALVVSTVHVQRYKDASERLAREAMASDERRAKIVGCALDGRGAEDCFKRFVHSFGLRAFRRPLTEAEQGRFLAVGAKAGRDFRARAEAVVQAILQSPKFLFRAETGVPMADRPGVRKLTGYELASRMAFTLWGTTPSPSLLAAAGAGELDSREGLARWAKFMLEDGRARPHAKVFYRQWLQLPELYHVRRPGNVYRNFYNRVRDAFIGETERFVDDFLWGEGVSMLDMLTARYSYVDRITAEIYGVSAPKEGYERVDFKPEHQRGGLLTHASVLTLSAPGGEVVAPVLRGKYVRDVLLCTPPPPPPPDVPPISRLPKGGTVRELLAEHRENPACAGCHGLMDPVGFGFEQYDLVGRYRPDTKDGKKLTGEGEIRGIGGDPKFVGPLELSARLRQHPDVPACVAKQMFRFTQGRTEGPQDRCALDEITKAFAASGHRFPALLIALVTSDTFRFVSDVTKAGDAKPSAGAGSAAVKTARAAGAATR